MADIPDAILTPMSAPQASTAPTRSQEVVLRTRNLTKHYGQRLAVDQLNLEVHRGDIFGFLGPNGTGKTTTIRMALGLITPSGGNVEILGQDIAALIETPALYLAARLQRLLPAHPDRSHHWPGISTRHHPHPAGTRRWQAATVRREAACHRRLRPARPDRRPAA